MLLYDTNHSGTLDLVEYVEVHICSCGHAPQYTPPDLQTLYPLWNVFPLTPSECADATLNTQRHAVTPCCGESHLFPWLILFTLRISVSDSAVQQCDKSSTAVWYCNMCSVIEVLEFNCSCRVIIVADGLFRIQKQGAVVTSSQNGCSAHCSRALTARVQSTGAQTTSLIS